MTRVGTTDVNGESPTDRSHLFVQPSPNSTDQPSQENLIDYGSSDSSIPKQDSAASFEMLLGTEGNEKQSSFQRLAFFVQRTFSKQVVATAGLLIIATVLLLALVNSAFLHSSADTRAVVPGTSSHSAFSILDPVEDLGLYSLSRPEDTSPPKLVLSESRRALPTNAWYQNLLMAKGEPANIHRVYPVPYVIDVVGPIPGLRAHPNHVDASTTVVQLSFVDTHGITLGAAALMGKNVTSKQKMPSKQYTVLSSTALAVTLEWKSLPMSATIAKGMPYTTMHYPKPLDPSKLMPSIASEIELESPPLADGSTRIQCGNHHAKATRVESEIKLTFKESDFTWLIFFSEPVLIRCIENPEDIDSAAVIFQVSDLAESAENDVESLTIRATLLTNCTTGVNQIFCRSREPPSKIESFAHLLREHAHLYPGPNADVHFDIDNDNDRAVLNFDWDVQNLKESRSVNTTDPVEFQLRRDTSTNASQVPIELLAFALPHHLHMMSNDYMPWEQRFCATTLIGTSCVVRGSTWNLIEELPPIGFRASRPPRPDAIPALSRAVKDDLPFKLHGYFERGAGDTYFSGKMLARIARVLVIAEELIDVCTPDRWHHMSYAMNRSEASLFAEACGNATLPTVLEMSTTLDRLRSSVEVWINGTAETPFVYDSSWGGIISCGCLFNDETHSCDNVFPNCPSISDQGLDFGNGFYNDHHFHYGYHIYGAAVVAHFDTAWGRKHFEDVLLLVRDIANPSSDDVHFPKYRHKDFYNGNSWASGVPRPPYLNGKNQESSSEAIASYESVALFGREMVAAWKDDGDEEKAQVAANVRDVGRLLAATEIRAADYYWHVRQHNNTMKIYPSAYTENAMGIVWSTMAQFQTWFGNARYLAYGIQLLPLTAISESRDNPGWLRELYGPFAKSCDADDACMKDGWSILQMAVLASVGHRELAFEKVGHLDPAVFDTAGGNGHSLSNTLWYVATRPSAEPIELPEADLRPMIPPEEVGKKIDCGIPDKCTDDVLDTDAKGFTCRERISWLIAGMGYTEAHACHKVAGGEFTKTCGLCDPGIDTTAENNGEQCPHCSREQCLSDLNRCPKYENSYVCIDGPNRGGCSPAPWELGPLCHSCCETTRCSEYQNLESDEDSLPMSSEEAWDSGGCIQCDKDICNDKETNLCPMNVAPFLCVKGRNKRGCSPVPWSDADCEKCCDLVLTCGHH